MRTALALLLVALLLAPSAGAARAPAAYPDPVAKLATKIVERVAPLEAESRNESWWADAQPWLERARDHAAQGRFHATLYDAETFEEIVVAHQLSDEVNRSAQTVGDQRTHMLTRVTAWRAESNDTWLAFRAKLHQVDGTVRSVQALETALFGADLALQSKAADSRFDAYVGAFKRQPGLTFVDIRDFARVTKSIQLDVLVAGDIVDAALAQDGVPPAILPEKWANFTAAARVDPGADSATLAPYEILVKPAREHNETILSLAATVVERTAQRLSEIQTVYGDAASRGLTVMTDADRGFQRQLNNTTLAPAQSRGLAGVFSADAIDKGVYVQDAVDNGTVTLGVIEAAWADLDHAAFANILVAALSPVSDPNAPGPESQLSGYVPPKVTPTKTPGLAPLVLVAALGTVALVMARRRGR